MPSAASQGATPASREPLTAQRYYSAACRAHDLGDLPAALTLYSASLQLDPSSVAAWIGRGVAHKAAKQFPRALSDYTRALHLAPDARTRVLVLSNRGNCHTASGAGQLALQDHQQAIQLATEAARQSGQPLGRADASLWMNRASALLRLGRLDEAQADLQHALSLDPAYALAQYNLGLCLGRQSNSVGAIASFEAASALFEKEGGPDASQHMEDCQRQIRFFSGAGGLETRRMTEQDLAPFLRNNDGNRRGTAGIDALRRQPSTRPAAVELPLPASPSNSHLRARQGANLQTPTGSPLATPASTPSSKRPFQSPNALASDADVYSAADFGSANNSSFVQVSALSQPAALYGGAYDDSSSLIAPNPSERKRAGSAREGLQMSSIGSSLHEARTASPPLAGSTRQSLNSTPRSTGGGSGTFSSGFSFAPTARNSSVSNNVAQVPPSPLSSGSVTSPDCIDPLLSPLPPAAMSSQTSQLSPAAQRLAQAASSNFTYNQMASSHKSTRAGGMFKSSSGVFSTRSAPSPNSRG